MKHDIYVPLWGLSEVVGVEARLECVVRFRGKKGTLVKVRTRSHFQLNVPENK